MIAQINISPGVITVLMLGIATLICGVYVWVAAHTANRQRHPNAETVIYKDFCKSTQKRFDERHIASEKRADERHAELRDLIIANGRSK